MANKPRKNFEFAETDSGLNNVRNAKPGEVQAKIDDVATSGKCGIVRLYAETDYSWTNLRVKSGVTLDFNGARLIPPSNNDLIEMDQWARVLNPIIDYSTEEIDFTFTSSVFVWNTKWAGRYVRPMRNWVRGGYTEGQPGEGTIFYLHDTQGKIIWGIDINHNTRHCDRVVDFHADDTNATVNGNIVRGIHQGFKNAVVTRGTGGTNGNTIRGVLHPDDPESDRCFYFQNGHSNQFIGFIWDEGRNSIATAEFTSGAGPANTILDYGSLGLPSMINNSGHGRNGGIEFESMMMTTNDDTVFGQNVSIADERQQTVIGRKAVSDHQRNTIIGALADGSNSGEAYQTIVGYDAGGSGATEDRTVIVGANADAQGRNSVAVGKGSESNGDDSIAIGRGALVSASSGIALGRDVSVHTADVARVGCNQLVFGGNDGGTIGDTDLEPNEITVQFDEANTQFVIRGKDGGGTVREGTVNY